MIHRMVEERDETKEVEDLEDPDQFLAMEAFVICEEDNENGLTWKEVSDCIVSQVNPPVDLYWFFEISIWAFISN